MPLPNKWTLADGLIFAGMAVNAVVITLILYFYVLYAGIPGVSDDKLEREAFSWAGPLLFVTVLVSLILLFGWFL
jgi:hypothetical protein